MTFVLEMTRPENTGSSMGVPVEMIPEDPVSEETDEPVRYNVLPVDFDALNASTDNEKLIALNNYFSQLPGTRQNAYTGMLKIIT